MDHLEEITAGRQYFSRTVCCFGVVGDRLTVLVFFRLSNLKREVVRLAGDDSLGVLAIFGGESHLVELKRGLSVKSVESLGDFKEGALRTSL